jgi:hypothetical protein
VGEMTQALYAHMNNIKNLKKPREPGEILYFLPL